MREVEGTWVRCMPVRLNFTRFHETVSEHDLISVIFRYLNTLKQVAKPRRTLKTEDHCCCRSTPFHKLFPPVQNLSLTTPLAIIRAKN